MYTGATHRCPMGLQGVYLSVSPERRQRRRVGRSRHTSGSASAAEVVKASASPAVRPRVEGKFLAVGTERLHVRGVTYGTFAPDADGGRFPTPDRVERDFEFMYAH